MDAARRIAAALGVERHQELTVDLAALGGSALTGDGAVPKDRELDGDGIPPTYVPARNTVLLSLALAWAEALNAPAPSSSASTPWTTRATRTVGRSTSPPSSGSLRWLRRPGSKAAGFESTPRFWP